MERLCGKHLLMISRTLPKVRFLFCFSWPLSLFQEFSITVGFNVVTVKSPGGGERRGKRKEEALDDLLLKDVEGAIVSQTNTGTVSKTTSGRPLRHGCSA